MTAPDQPDTCPDHGVGQDCCSLTCGPIDQAQSQRLAMMFKALADPTRLRLLSHIASQGRESVCACDLTAPLGVNQSTVSHHTTRLVDAGLLAREQRGRWAYYTAIPEAFAELRSFLDLS